MTEEEWLACGEPRTMLRFLADQATPTARKQRLLACACVRRLWHLFHDDARNAVELAERFADGGAETADLRAAQEELKVGGAPSRFTGPRGLHAMVRLTPAIIQSLLAYSVVRNVVREPHDFNFYFHFSAGVANVLARDKPTQEARDECFRSENQQLRALAREVIGNPFCPVTFAPEWTTDTGVAIARQMYESRDFSAMPILADALQDAGCDHEGVLAHCRDPQQIHVRGCWVVDLVLGKE